MPTETTGADEFWEGIWWVQDGTGKVRNATAGECAAEIARLRATVETWCNGQLAMNDQILAAVTLIQDKINDDIITEINDPRNSVEGAAFRSGLRVARCIVNRVIGDKETADAKV